MKTIVISAVNLVEAGTLAILKDCLSYLSKLNNTGNYRIIAIVYKKELINLPNIEYIETQWPKKKWINRLWFEYVSMNKIAINLGNIDLWLSLHDTSPSVKANKRAVYCHNSFSFYKWKFSDLLFSPKIALFAIFTKYIYKPNIHKNDYLIVQQNWFRDAMSKIFFIDKKKIIVAPPEKAHSRKLNETYILNKKVSFIFAGSPNSHKNFECICKAVEILHKKFKNSDFIVYITVDGSENKYARWLFSNWGNKYESLKFIGFINRFELENYYKKCHCLIYPSKVETWGLPISEFSQYKKPMLLADLPYAHETSAESNLVSFFNPDSPDELATKMYNVIKGDLNFLKEIPPLTINEPITNSWEELFNKLLND